MSTSTDIFRHAGVDLERDEQARRAVLEGRKFLPTLTTYARRLTKDNSVIVEMATRDNGSTNGKKIFWRPPMALGDRTPHQRSLCNRRGDDYQQQCSACAKREDVLAVIYHEIAHICFESFQEVQEDDKINLIKQAIEAAGGKYAEAIKRKIQQAPYWTKSSYMGMCNLVSEYSPMIFNALEDARVNRELFKVRKGTKSMFDALCYKTFRDGVEQLDAYGNPTVIEWRDYPLDAQAIVGLFAKASGYDYSGWFQPSVVEALNDTQLTRIVNMLETTRSAAGVYRLGFPVLQRLRELGFCKLPDDPEPEPEPESEPEPEPQPEGESEDECDDTPSDEPGSDPRGSEDSNEPEDADGESGSDEEPGPSESGGDAAGGSEEPEEAADAGSEGEDSDAGASNDGSDSDGSDGEASADSSGDDDSDESADSSGSGESGEAEEVGGSSSSEPESGGDSPSGVPGDTGGDSPGEADTDEPQQTAESLQGSGDIEGEPLDNEETRSSGDSDEPGDGDPEGDSESESDSGSDGSGESSGESTDDDQLSDASDNSTSEGPGSDEVDDSEEIDTGADRGTGGTEVVENSKNDDKPIPEHGTPEDAKIALLKLGDHEEAPKRIYEDELDDEAIDRAIIQGIYFETPSRNIYGVREHRFDKHVEVNGKDMAQAWLHDAWFYAGHSKRALGIEGDFDPAEQILAPALTRMRIAFSDNARGKKLEHLKSGRVNARVLGRRAWNGDERLFARRTQPGKKSYFVLIGMDISGSTLGKNIALEKRAVMAQAELCHRMGIKFAVMAHSGNFHAPGGSRSEGMDLDIYIIKEPNEPWTDLAKERLRQIGPDSANLDGHTLEYYRKFIERRTETDKIIMYYTDGKMPAENHDEELVILQREIKVCKRQNITLMGVGIRTDSPVRHGLDTVQVDGDQDIVKVVRHLEKRLSPVVRAG